MLRTKQVTWGKHTVTVQEQSALQVFEEYDTWRDIGKAILGEDFNIKDMPRTLDWYLIIVTRTVETNLPFAFPGEHSTDDEWCVGYEGFLQLPGKFITAWFDAIQDLNKPPVGDPDLALPEQLPEAKKKTEE